MPGAILLIEDNDWHRRIYSATLRAHDYRPVEVVDPREAILIAIQSDAALALIDIRLPAMDGRDIIRAMREDVRTSAISILAISAAPDPEMAESCLAAGAHRFRAKPVPLLDLVDDIRTLCA